MGSNCSDPNASSPEPRPGTPARGEPSSSDDSSSNKKSRSDNPEDELQLLRRIQAYLTKEGAKDIRTSTTHPRTVSVNEILVGKLRIMVEPDRIDRTQRLRNLIDKTGINPVTFTPQDRTAPRLVLARLNVGTKRRMRRTITALMHNNDNTQDDNMLGLAVFNEDHIITGLLHLFPHGELAESGASEDDQIWPFRKLKWETSDGQEWSHPDIANGHQRMLNRDVTTGGEGNCDSSS